MKRIRSERLDVLDEALEKMRTVVAKHPQGVRYTIKGAKGQPPRQPTGKELRRDAVACKDLAVALVLAAQDIDGGVHPDAGDA